MSWRTEAKEHPWATKTQAKRIAADHAKQKKQHHRTPKTSTRTPALFDQKVPLQYVPEYLGKMKQTEAEATRIGR